MARTFLQVCGLLLSAGAAVFLVRGAYTLTAESIVALSQTRFDFNRDVARSLATQKADAQIGVALLIASAIGQFTNIAWPMRNVDFEVSFGGLLLAIAFFVAVMVGAWRASADLSQRELERVEASHRANLAVPVASGAPDQ